jgi:periplasmic protein CpxP/Spy
MKRHLVAGALVLAAVSVTAFAFNGPGGPQGHRHGRGGPGGPPLGHIVTRMASDLGLSDAQKTTIEQIVAEERQSAGTVAEQLRASGDQLKDLGTDGQFDEARVRAIAEQHAKVMVELTVSRERAKAKVFAALTPEQRTKLVEKMKSFGPPGHPPES